MPISTIIYRILFIPWFIFCLQSVQAQFPTADSLKRVLVKVKPDTMRVNMLGELAYALRSIKTDSALLLGRQAKELAQSLNYSSKVDNITRLLGIFHFYAQNPDSASWYFEEAERLAIQDKDTTTLANVLLNHATLYKSQSNISKALELYEKALKIEVERGNTKGEAAALNNIGTIYLDQKAYDKAEEYFLNALAVYRRLNNKSFQCIVLNNLGLTTANQNDQEKSIDYFQKSLVLTREIEDKQLEATTLSRIAYTYKRRGDFSKSLEYYLKHLRLWESLAIDSEVASASISVGDVYKENKDLDSAAVYYNRALGHLQKSKDQKKEALVLTNIGNLKIEQGEFSEAFSNLSEALKIHQTNFSIKSGERALLYYALGSCYENLNQLDSAKLYLQKSLAISKEIRAEAIEANTRLSLGKVYEKQGDFSGAIASVEKAVEICAVLGLRKIQSQAASLLHRLYKSQNNTAKALIYIEMHKSLQDSLFNRENTRALAQIEANYQFEKEKQQLEFEQEQRLAEGKNTQLIIAIILGITLLTLGAVVWYFFQKQKANERLRQLNKEILAQKEKLEELDVMKSRFFTNISHEFRTPLTIISGNINHLIKKNPQGTPRGYEVIQRNSNQLLDLVNQILDLRKLESGNLTANMIQDDVVSFVHYIFESFESLAERKGLQTHFVCDEDKIIMDYDAQKLERIIFNLLSNAIKFTPEEGDVYVLLKSFSKKKQAYLSIRVKDTGEGIPEDKLPQIFDRFYQVDHGSLHKGEGSGIGLSLVKELVKALNGEIEVRSEWKKGSTFHIKLPITRKAELGEFHNLGDSLTDQVLESLAQNQDENLEVEVNQQNSDLPSILLIEDNKDVRQYLIDCLRGEYQLSWAEDGEAGIEKALEMIPDAIISDVMMPRKDGYEVCHTLKNDIRTSHIPIILLTARVDIDSKLAGLRKGADDYLAKPFNEEELLVRIGNQLQIRQILQARFQTEALGSPTEEVEKDVEHEFLQKIRKELESHLSEAEYEVADLCLGIGMSRTQLHRKMKALTGESTSHFIRKVRLHKAKELLTNTDMNVSEVSYEVGFKYPNSFSRAYLKEFGVQPSDIRH